MENQATKRAPQQWIKVMTRFASKKERAQRAKAYESQYGKPPSDPDGFNLQVAFAVDHCGFLGAFEKAKEYIATNKQAFGGEFEYRLDGGEW